MNRLPANIENWLVFYIVIKTNLSIKQAFIKYSGYSEGRDRSTKEETPEARVKRLARKHEAYLARKARRKARHV